MDQVKVCTDLGTKATFFGLGLLASKKMRPYAKYFIVGGLALSAAPVVVQLVEKHKLQRIELEEQVEEVRLEDEAVCCEEEKAEDTTEADAEPCACECEEQKDVEEKEEETIDA